MQSKSLVLAAVVIHHTCLAADQTQFSLRLHIQRRTRDELNSSWRDRLKRSEPVIECPSLVLSLRGRAVSCLGHSLAQRDRPRESPAPDRLLSQGMTRVVACDFPRFSARILTALSACTVYSRYIFFLIRAEISALRVAPSFFITKSKAFKFSLGLSWDSRCQTPCLLQRVVLRRLDNRST